MMDFEAVKEITTTLKEARADKEANWSLWQKQYMETLPRRTGTGSQDMPTINMNETFKAVLTNLRFGLMGFWNNQKIYKTNPVAINDIPTSEFLNFYIGHKVKKIEGIFETLLRVMLQNFTIGTTAGKFNVIDKGKFEVDCIPMTDIWLDDQVFNYKDIRYIMHAIPISRRELLNRIDDDKYDRVKVLKFIEEVAKADRLKEEIERKDYELYELWYKTDKWYVTTSGTYEGEPLIQFRDEKSDLIYDHPFLLGFNIPSQDSLYAHGDAELLRSIQEGENRILNDSLDWIHTRIRPTAIIEHDAVDDASDIEPLINPERGGAAWVHSAQGVREWGMGAQLSPQSFGMLSALQNFGEDITGLPGILSGEEPSKREPGITTARRQHLAQGVMAFRLLIFGETFMRQLGKNILMSILENPPEKDIVRMTGTSPTTFYQVGAGTQTELKPEKPMEFGGKSVNIITANIKKMTRTEIKEFVDIEIEPAYFEEPDDSKRRRYLDTLDIIGRVGAIAPWAIMPLDMNDILKQILSIQGFEIANAFKTDWMSEMMSNQQKFMAYQQLMSKMGGQGGQPTKGG